MMPWSIGSVLKPKSDSMKPTGVTEAQTRLVWLTVYLAVSFHSASSPSLRQISSNSVNRAWGMCSSSPSSVPNKNCTLWAGVSAAANETNGERWIVKRRKLTNNSIKCLIVVLLLCEGDSLPSSAVESLSLDLFLCLCPWWRWRLCDLLPRGTWTPM